VELRVAVYGLGRLAFGTALLTAPTGFGRLLAGDAAREAAVRASLRAYGTRDVVLGLGTLRAVATGSDVSPWLTAGVAADLLDTSVQVADWADLPPDRRLLGVLSALASAGIGIALLARR
jgi:hypothetical protein